MSKAKNQLVIVEGLTGLGKSTLAHFIARQFQYNGVTADWIHEGEYPHPVSVDIGSDLDAFMVASLGKWEAFVAQILKSGKVTVIEAGFFNNLIETLFTHRLDLAAIQAYGMKLQGVIRAANPALIYLIHPDIPGALEKNFLNRGPRFEGFVTEFVSNTPIAQAMGWKDRVGVVKFWSEFVAVTDALFQEFDMEKLAVDVSGDSWEQYHQQVLNFLGLTWIADPEIGSDRAAKFVGHYQFSEGGKIHTIQYKNGVLVTDIFVNVATELIPKNGLTFLTDKWHFELIFDIDHAGEVTSFSVGGRDIDYLKAVGLKAVKVLAR